MVKLGIEGQAAELASTDTGLWRLGIVLDPVAGEVVEVHEYEVGEIESEAVTIDERRLVGRRGVRP